MTNQAPLVSVVMPVYKAEKYLAASIKGILDQRHQNLELIVINDGSPDRSADIIHSFQDDRIRYVENEKNLGVVCTRNKGISLSRGKYISFNDADDIPLPFKLEHQVNYLENNPEIGICGTFYQLIDQEGNPGEKITLPASSADVALMAKFINPFCNSATLTRSDLVKAVGFEKNFEYSEDFRLWTQLLQQTKGVNLPEYSLLYRVHGNNISIVNKQAMWNRSKVIHREGLTTLGVPFTDDELDLHTKFLYCSQEDFTAPGRLSELDHWLTKLYRIVKIKNPELDQLSLKKLLFENWIAISFYARNFRKVLFPGLALISPLDYYPVFFKKIAKKIF
ncbi:MAG: glycosyltransferase [Chitinophagaceae bacterium]|jgi:glycosyltransferase involved in cell wall biosynthesis|nr:glycosyltransferase [Chitinophagaceae bacterium]